MTPPDPIVIVTRPAPAAAILETELRAQTGAALPVILSPLIEIVPVAATLPPGPLGGAVVTSVNGAAALDRLGVARDLPVWCVGDRTAQAVRATGRPAHSADGDAEALVALILSAGMRGPLVHLRGAMARGDVAARLTAAGVPCAERVVYDQQPRALTPAARAALDGSAPVVLPVFSPATGAQLLRQGPFRAPIFLVAISRAAADACTGLPHRALLIADRPDGPTMRRLTIAAIRQARALEGGGQSG